jgi:hypothetical protein
MVVFGCAWGRVVCFHSLRPLSRVNRKAQSLAGKVGNATVARGAQRFWGVEFLKSSKN